MKNDLLNSIPKIYSQVSLRFVFNDFFLTIISLYVGVYLWVQTSYMGLGAVVTFFAAYRASAFIHEINHSLKKKTLFRFVYMFFFGGLFRLPANLYNNHYLHHSTQSFGTEKDPKYGDVRRRLSYFMAYGVLNSFVSPLLLIIRYTVAYPLHFLRLTATNTLWKMTTPLPVNSKFSEPTDKPKVTAMEQTEDLLTWIASTTLIALAVVSPLFLTVLLVTYLTSSVVFLLDWVHFFAAHIYETKEGKVSFQEQVEDSVSFDVSFLWDLLFPVGMKYHSTHHLFADIPYHNIGKVHRRLMHELPRDHYYRKTVRSSVIPFYKELAVDAIRS